MDNFTLHMISISLLFLLPTLLYYILQRRAKRSNKSTSASPPSPWLTFPIVGHLHLLTAAPHHAFTRLAHRLGPLFQLRLGQVTTVVVSSAHHAHLVLKTHDHVFASRPQLLAARYLSFGCSDVTFSTYGPYWRQARRICVSELLSSKRVNSFQLVRDQEVTRLLTAVSLCSGLETNMSELFFGLANDILCRVAFGRRFEEEREKGHLVRVLTETQELLAGFCMGDFFPEWRWVDSVTGFKQRLLKNLKDLSAVCDEIIEEHLQKKQGGSQIEKEDFSEDEKEDFVDVLLRVQSREDLEVPITFDNLKALVLDMFVAGTDTTSATLEWTLTELVRHPRVMKKVQDEVRRVTSGTRKLEASHLQHLCYMKAVIKEAMRLHPPVPLLVPRESIKDCNLDGYRIPAKTRVLINAYAIGRDPDSWNNPLEFIPERFEEENIEFKDQDFRFLPFGGGRRGCPGFNFGLATVETALARLLYHVDWELPRGAGVDDVDLGEIFGLATRKRTPLVLVPRAREDFEIDEKDA